MRLWGRWTGIWLAALLGGSPALAQTPEFAQARIVVAATSTPVERQAAAMLREEVEKRTGLRWAVGSGGEGVRIVLADRGQVAGLVKGELPQPAAAESFAVRVRDGGRTVVVVGADDRGVLFGAGYLLRHLAMGPGRVAPVGLADIDSAPAYPVRGHQLGYRPKNNTFDGWTAAQFEQYIRDLAIFGTNTIELIPPRSDDDATSPLYTLAPMPMMVELSKILDRYGLDCSIWYPALDKDYADPATVDAAVAEWGAVFDQLPRVDAIFVPGGDPGHTEPKYLLALLEKEAARLRRKHPRAQVWVSPQSFSAAWMEEFYGLLAQKPGWLTGVVYGPEMRDSPEEFRRRVPAQFPVRLYPDITHVLDAQYPVPNLDPAFALTEGREPVNPRPVDESILFHRYIGLSTGFVAYSEGANDDVNKVLWSGWGWDPRQPAQAILTEYARTFISAAISSDESGPLVSAIAGLEANWRGPIASNPSIEPTLALLQGVEGREPRLATANWRFQQLLYRGYYDAYTQLRARREQAAERAALAALRARPLTDAALDAAKAALGAPAVCGDDALCRRVEGLAEDLFRSIRMQLSVPKYKALAVGRGANLDRVDAPLTDAVWLGARIAEARAEADLARRAALTAQTLAVLGADGAERYDVLGDAARAPRLVRGKSFEQDPSGLQGTYLGVSGASAAGLPLAGRSVAGTLYDRPLELFYRDLPPHRGERVEVRFVADARRFTLLANGAKVEPVCEDAAKCLDAVYTVGAEQVPAGELRLAFSIEPGRGGNGRAVAVATVRISPAK